MRRRQRGHLRHAVWREGRRPRAGAIDMHPDDRACRGDPALDRPHLRPEVKPPVVVIDEPDPDRHLRVGAPFAPVAHHRRDGEEAATGRAPVFTAERESLRDGIPAVSKRTRQLAMFRRPLSSIHAGSRPAAPGRAGTVRRASRIP
jgi:hypothetical protein